jgi:hypothetical protein
MVREGGSNGPLNAVTVVVLDGPNAQRSTISDTAGNYALSGLVQTGLAVRFAGRNYNNLNQSAL